MEIKQLKKYDKTLVPAPDKSITHRALMLNGLMCEGESVIKNALMGQDCISTVGCIRQLGGSVEFDGRDIRLCGVRQLSSGELNVGNSGTTLRLIAGILAGQSGTFTLDGDASIRRRPMKRVIHPLKEMGAKITAQEGGLAPLTVQGTRLHGITYEMPVASAQVKSSILLAGLNADGVTCVVERTPTRDHTEIMLKSMGARLTSGDGRISVERCRLQNIDVDVPGDISSAAFPLVLAAIIPGGRVKVTGVGVNPTRTGILDVLQACGASVELTNVQGGAERVADIELNACSTLIPFTIGGDIVPRLIDEIPALAVLACFIEGTSVITGAAELKVKESNRIDMLVRTLSAMGAKIRATDDGMVIEGNGTLRGGVVIDPQGDHRIAMSAAIAGAAARRGVTVLGASAANISYPGFYESVLGEENFSGD